MDNEFKPPSTPTKLPTPKAVLPPPYYKKPIKKPSPALLQPPPVYMPFADRTKMVPPWFLDEDAFLRQRSVIDIKESSKAFRVSGTKCHAAVI